MEIPQALQVPAELEKLLELVKGKRLVLEIGTARGGTLYSMLQCADPNAEVVSIDLPGGSYGGEYGQPEESVMQSWCQPGQKLHVLRGDSRAVGTVLTVKSILGKRKFDFVLIDGDHSYEGVKADFETYSPLASDVIAFHDIAHHANADIGVEKFWKELKGDKTEIVDNRYQGWAGIGIYRVHQNRLFAAVGSVVSKLADPKAAFDAFLYRYCVNRHGRGAPHQDMFHRCTNCRRIITWKTIAAGKVCCGGKVATTDLRPLEVFRVLFLPWTV